MSEIKIRLLEQGDSIEELTFLLNRAYSGLSRDGLNFTATDQDSETTKRRISEGECWIAELDAGIVGTVMLVFGGDDHDPPTYLEPGVAHFGQFGVEPEVQGNSIGTELLKHIECRARELGATVIALDTAEPATRLVAYYERQGYSTIATHQWGGKTYRSLIMAKPL